MIHRFLILLLIPLGLCGQSGGNTVFSFLDRSIFAGSSALANTAYLNPTNVGAYAVQNPLLLTDSNAYQIEASYGTLGDGIQLMQASAGVNIKGQLLMLGIQNIGYGTFNQTDTWGNGLGSFTAGDLAVSVGTKILDFQGWSLGANFKVVNGSYERYQSWAAATDFALMKRFENAPDVVVMAKNIGGQINAFGDSRESLPANLLFAVGDKLKYAPFRWTFVVDQLQRPNLGYDDPNNITVDPITGEETQNNQDVFNLALRHLSGSLEFLPTTRTHFMLGYSFRRQYEMALPSRRTSGGFTLGAGMYFDRFTFHFANELRSVAGRMNTVSLGINL